MRLSGFAVAVSCLLVSSPSLAQNETPSPMPLEEREAREAVSKALKGLAEAYGEIYETKQSQCMRAIGNREFCDCIALQSPSGIDFVEYVRIVSTSKADLNYDALSPEDKELVDNTRTSRDKCVAGDRP
jgi:hypothetical protein